jgi:hypothetical protein
MNDCPNAEIRDQLPDLLHDRLDVSMRAAVMAHVDDCVDCRSELELLRGVQGMLAARTPRVDINYVVNALPKRAPQSVRVIPRRPVWTDWRIAAAVTVLVVGGGSFAVLRQSGVGPGVVPPAVSVSEATPAASDSMGRSPVVPAESIGRVADAGRSQTVSPGASAAASDQGASAGLATTARLADLNERQLQALLDQIDQLQAVPITEPEPVTIRVGSQSSSPEGA